MSENLADAERNFREVLNSGRRPFRDDSYVLLDEYDKRGAERDEALALLQELVWFRKPRAGNYLHGTAIRDAEDDAWGRAEALVERTSQGDET